MYNKKYIGFVQENVKQCEFEPVYFTSLFSEVRSRKIIKAVLVVSFVLIRKILRKCEKKTIFFYLIYSHSQFIYFS